MMTGHDSRPQTLTVAIYGASLFMQAVAARLQRDHRLCTTRFDPQRPEACEQLRQLAPDAVLVEGSDPCALNAIDSITLTSNGAHPLVIGFDKTQNYQMVVLSGEHYPSTEAQHLIDVIASQHRV